jgi:hypothetical protein
VLRKGGGADSVITQAMLSGPHESVKNVYQNVVDKYQVTLSDDLTGCCIHTVRYPWHEMTECCIQESTHE